MQEVFIKCEEITKWSFALRSILKQTHSAKLQHHLPFEECLWTDLVNKHLVENVENIYYQRPADCEGINMKYMKMKAQEDDGHLRKENLEVVYRGIVYDCEGNEKEQPIHAVTEHLAQNLTMNQFVDSGLEGYLDMFKPPFLSRCPITQQQQIVILLAMTAVHYYPLIIAVCGECPAIQLVSKEPETLKTSISKVGMKLVGDLRNITSEGSSQEAVEKLRSLTSLPVVKVKL